MKPLSAFHTRMYKHTPSLPLSITPSTPKHPNVQRPATSAVLYPPSAAERLLHHNNKEREQGHPHHLGVQEEPESLGLDQHSHLDDSAYLDMLKRGLEGRVQVGGGAPERLQVVGNPGR